MSLSKPDLLEASQPNLGSKPGETGGRRSSHPAEPHHYHSQATHLKLRKSRLNSLNNCEKMSFPTCEHIFLAVIKKVNFMG